MQCIQKKVEKSEGEHHDIYDKSNPAPLGTHNHTQ